MRWEWEPFFRYHVDHIIPRKHDGGDEELNLAQACHKCNLNKGTNLSGIDPVTKRIVTLFNPRIQVWKSHFEIREAVVYGLTECGRATIRVLMMNNESRVELRHLEVN